MNDEEKYREEHGVIEQLDFVNFENPYDNMKTTEVKHSRFATTKGAKKVGGGKMAKGLGKTVFSIFAVSCGGGWYAAHEAADGVKGFFSGANDHKITGDIVKSVVDTIIDYENDAWKMLEFTRSFVPASGNIGDIVFKDGSCDDFHCGNGHRFFENGDYFEGYFEDGEIKKGIYIWSDGKRYLGEFDNEKRMTGLGIIVFPNGTYYFGGLQAGVKHGSGIQIYDDGVFGGEWQNNQRIFGALKLDNGNCFLRRF